MIIQPRTAWRAALPRLSLQRLSNASLTHIVNHWPGDPRNLANRDTAELMRSWQRNHMDTRKWRDIGYNYVVDANGKIWEARGWNVGGHVLGNQNNRSVGILFAVGNNEPMTGAMQNAGHELRAWIEAMAGRELSPIGHSDWANKLCPGPYVLPWTRRGMPRADGDTVPVVDPLVAKPSKVGEVRTAPRFPLGRCTRHGRNSYFGPKSGPDHSVSGYFQRRAGGRKGHQGLFDWQERMAYRGWRITPDGLYGNETKRVALAFQKEKGLSQDGLIGTDTWRAAWESPIT